MNEFNFNGFGEFGLFLKINSAEINGMTGNLEYKKNACTKRTIPLQSVSSNWVAH